MLLLEQLFVQYRAALYAYCKSKIGCGHLADDLSQEAWLRLVHSPRWATQSLDNPRAYLFRIADNLIVDHVRRQKNAPASAEETDVDAFPCPAPRPDATADADEQQTLLLRAIADLPPRCRDAFLLHKVDGLRYSEVAEHLGISIKTVEKHVAKALHHCRRQLAEANSHDA